MVRPMESAPTGPGSFDSGPSSPSAEKSSQKNMGEFHQRLRSHPRKYVTLALAESSAESRKLPLRASLAGSSGLLMRMPDSRSDALYSLTRVSLAGVRPVGFSMDHAMETLAGTVPGLVTRYRRMATGRPDSS